MPPRMPSPVPVQPQAINGSINSLKKEVNLSVKFSKKTPTIVTKYHNRAIKLKNNINFLKIDKI